MKIKKEVWLVTALVAFLLSYLIDKIAGPVVITVGNPVAFLSSPVLLNLYPFTAAAILIRSVGLFVSALLIVSIVEKQYFAKAIFLVFIGVLAEFYAIQQLANGFKMTTIQWTLAIAYGSVLLVIGIIGLILKGIWAMFNRQDNSAETNNTTEIHGQDHDTEDSILKP